MHAPFSIMDYSEYVFKLYDTSVDEQATHLFWRTTICDLIMRKNSPLGGFVLLNRCPLWIHITCALILNRRPLFTWLITRRFCFWHSIQPGYLVHTQESTCRFTLTNIIVHIHNKKPSSVQICRYLHPGYPSLKGTNSDFGMDKQWHHICFERM